MDADLETERHLYRRERRKQRVDGFAEIGGSSEAALRADGRIDVSLNYHA
jgi:hypothetical protein